MDLHLEGKCALVTGSTAGIGFAIAESLLKEGAEVIINGQRKEELDHAVHALSSFTPGSKVSGVVADLQDPGSIDSFNHILTDVDILINNVGVYAAKDFENTSEEDWRKMLEVNLMSGVRLSRLILPYLLQKKWGRIIFISSECSQLVPDNLIAYSATKAAAEAVTKGLAQRCKGTAVTVNSIMPGSTLTEGALRFLEEEAQKTGISPKEVEADFFRNTRTSSLASRFLDPKEVADVVTFIASQNSSAINGATVNATGGSVR